MLIYPDPYLVGGDWNMTFIFPYDFGMSSSQLTNSYFSEGFVQPPTSYSMDGISEVSSVHWFTGQPKGSSEQRPHRFCWLRRGQKCNPLVN